VGHTRLLRTISVPLREVTDAAHRAGATVNDLALTAVAGGVGRFLRDRGEPSDGGFLHVMVPVSVRRDDEHLMLGNRVSAVLVALPLADSSPASRLAAVRDRMRAIKGHEQARGTEVLLQGVEVVPAGLLALMSRAIHHQPVTDLVVTNIPGPVGPLYFLGAELLESTPIVPLGGNLMIGIAVLSYNGRLTLGVHADGSACPDVGELVDAIQAELDDLTRAALPSRQDETVG
jgi:WS/DGAT/MGAT family acyltransferase